jgi:hypothetical protein
LQTYDKASAAKLSNYPRRKQSFFYSPLYTAAPAATTPSEPFEPSEPSEPFTMCIFCIKHQNSFSLLRMGNIR